MLGVCRLEEEIEEKETRGEKAQRVRAGDDKPKCHTHPLCPSPYLSVSAATTPLPALRAPAQSMPLIPLSGEPWDFNDNEIPSSTTPFQWRRNSFVYYHTSRLSIPAWVPWTLSPLLSSPLLPPGHQCSLTQEGLFPELPTQCPLTCQLHLYFSKALNIFPIL